MTQARTHVSDLRDRLQKLKLEDQSQPGRYFVPKGLLAEVFSLKDVSDALAQHPFRVPLHRYEDACEVVFRRGLAVFATLLDSGLCQHLDRLLEENLLDGSLPFTQAALEPILGEDAQAFAAAQYTFLPHEFEYYGYHRRLRRGTVLPYTLVKPIGGGRSSKVFKVKIHPSSNHLVRDKAGTDAFYIRKEIDITGFDGPGVDTKESELLYYLRALKHECIAELLSSYSLDGVPNLIFRCADYDLSHFLQHARPQSLNQLHQILKALHGLSCGLRHLHNYRLIPRGDYEGSTLSFQGCHHDLKPKNVLVQGNKFILSDFGLSRLKDMEQDSKTPWQNAAFEYGAPECRDPETFRSGKVGRASDVWSLGCIVLEVLTYIHGGPDSVKNFKKLRRFEGKRATAYAFHHDGAASPAVESQIDLVSQPSAGGEDSDTVSIPFLRDIFALQTVNRPAMSVVEHRISRSTIETILMSLVPAIDALITTAGDGNGVHATNVFRAQMLLELGRLKAWAAALDLMPESEETRAGEPRLEDAFSAYNLPEVYRLLDKAFSYVKEKSPRGSKNAQQPLIGDIEGYDSTLPELHQLNNRLFDLLARPERQRADQLFPALVRSVGDGAFLSAISTEAASRASSEYQAVGQLAAMRYMTSLMLKSSGFTARMEGVLLSPDTNTDNDPTVGPRLYWYNFDHVRRQRVHVERIRYGTKWVVDINSEEFKKIGEKLFERIDQLAVFLRDVEKPAELRTLHCIGAYHWAEKKHFGLVYEVPDPEKHLITLYKLLDWRKSHPPPDVDDKYCLALALARTVNCIHLSGWVHKNLNPLNVVFLHHSRTDLRNIDYKEPYIIGFDYSRQEGANQYTEGPDEHMRAEYQHKAYCGGSAAFQTSFDYYSLGLMLLEIGLWSPLSSIYGRNKELSPEELGELYLQYCDAQLLKSMPKRYAGVVRECLRLTGTDARRDEMIFQTRVLTELRSLSS